MTTLNTFERMVVNSRARALAQKHLEARWLLQMGGAIPGARALEIGCGRGVGVEIIFEQFGAATVDAFDLDPKMVEEAKARLFRYEDRLRLWVGDATRIDAPDASYDAVFDFGIIHHIPDWRAALREVYRVLAPGGRFYASEVLRRFIVHPLWKRLFDHPLEDRFDAQTFATALVTMGFQLLGRREIFGQVAWFAARRPG